MATETVIQGRVLSDVEIGLIRDLIRENPSWHRTRLSQEICNLWNWKNDKGRLKDMACRTLLLKLHRRGWIQLPPPLTIKNNRLRNEQLDKVNLDTAPIQNSLKSLQPISVQEVQDKKQQILFAHLLHCYHYLGYSGSVGENIKYLVWDAKKRPLAAALFGSAAWKTQPRDEFIGWSKLVRERNLVLITNNQRFLIAPWVSVKNLASHILSRIVRRISDDWIQKYGHPIYLLETFVDQSRFQGICYQAANWHFVGKTKGRSRQDRHHRLSVPIKAIYLYPLVKEFRRCLHETS